MIFRTLISASVLFVAACETVPTTFDPAQFDTEIEQIAKNPSVVSAEAALTRLLTTSHPNASRRVDT